MRNQSRAKTCESLAHVTVAPPHGSEVGIAGPTHKPIMRWRVAIKVRLLNRATEKLLSRRVPKPELEFRLVSIAAGNNNDFSGAPGGTRTPDPQVRRTNSPPTRTGTYARGAASSGIERHRAASSTSLIAQTSPGVTGFSGPRQRIATLLGDPTSVLLKREYVPGPGGHPAWRSARREPNGTAGGVASDECVDRAGTPGVSEGVFGGPPPP